MSYFPIGITPEQATQFQREIAPRIRIQPPPKGFQRLASAWVTFHSPEPRTAATATCVLLDWPSLEVLETATATMEVDFPYISGLFAFRAGPPLLASLEALQTRPDVLLLNAQGIAHVRRCGMASHIGLLTRQPTVGCTRQRPPFTVEEPAPQRGSTQLIMKGERTLGAVVRVCDNVKPLYVSPGHLVDIEFSIQLILHCCRGYRLPEPLRIARMLANDAMEGIK